MIFRILALLLVASLAGGAATPHRPGPWDRKMSATTDPTRAYDHGARPWVPFKAETAPPRDPLSNDANGS